MPIDINWIRAEKGGDPEKWRECMRMRFKDAGLIDRVLELDQQWRKAQFDIEQTKKDLGAQQKKVAELKKSGAGAEAEPIIAAMAAVKATLPEAEAGVEKIKDSLDRELSKIPNTVDPSVPVSKNEEDNAVVKTWGECTTREGLYHHHELLTMIDGYEPERGVAVAGHRAYFLKGAGLLLNQALINYGLSFLMTKDYTPLQPPFFMNKESMAGVAQLEDFDEQLYKVVGTGSEEGEGQSEKYLIATSEQPMCVYHRGEWLQEKDLPKRYAGFSTCFRKEAGSHGRDAWGIFRVHQFEKVEQFVVCEPEASPAHHKEMIETAEAFYQSLGIPYRVVNICSGELNNAAAIKYDLEGWFPTLARYRELVSCSNCTDYQSRAMEVRIGAVKGKEASATVKKYAHFLNATLCATTRVICAILENNQVRARAARPPPPPSRAPPPLRAASGRRQGARRARALHGRPHLHALHAGEARSRGWQGHGRAEGDQGVRARRLLVTV
jgi:seryl-tRNA synthetase